MKVRSLRVWWCLTMAVCVGLASSGFSGWPLADLGGSGTSEPNVPSFIRLGERTMSDRLQGQGPDVLAGLSDVQVKALQDNGFVVVPDTAPQIYSIYQQASKQSWPVFVTTDATLHTYHVLFDYALRQTESEYLIPALGKLTKGMMQASLEQMQATGGDVQAAARSNVAFFGVAQSLLDPAAVDSGGGQRPG